MKKAVACVVSSMFLASSAFASKELLKCKWVATGEVEGRLRLIEGKEFEFPIDVEKGFFYYLENGMQPRQKEALARAGVEFFKQVEQIRRSGRGDVFEPAGWLCRDENTKEGVVIIYFRD
jgi:hypothetical protein